eukprot:TRINITY_DN72950_c0_g1_i1.p1 TRINITY_DN72950_c0_g1~~TRINITY_DN72950_c0_g1_i1.p1  ORF type:complete len:725 (+),score=109.46 TRINITY_DN72950_c0_g1_i1:62-2236(+)
MPVASFRKGEEVYVFYRVSTCCRPQRKYVATLDPRQGAWRPRTGLNDGWVPAVVSQDCIAGGQAENKVAVEYTWPHFYTSQGNLAEREPSGFVTWFDMCDVKRPEDLADKPSTISKPSGGWPLVPLGSVPDLAIITFRWGGMNEVRAPEQWGSTGSPVSDLFIDSFIDSTIKPELGGNFEVWTVYVENSIDLCKLADTAHLIFGPNHPARRARNTCAMYFLYPTGFEENCIPTRETGEDGGAALMDQKSLFRMIKAVERAGVQTKFPHPSGFYEVLTSKRWTSMMSLVPHLRVPPTVSLPRQACEHSCANAAAMALSALTDVRNHQYTLRKEQPPKTAITRGVAKLGYSWEALDVKFWDGEDGLEEALYSLTQAIEINDEYTGQPHDLESIMIQEYCAHDLELRLYVVDGKVEGSIYTKFCKIKENNEFGDFHETFERDEAADNWMGGDKKALVDGERQCREIVNHWLFWIKSQICELPPAIRFDFFVGRSPQAGKATVWTLEICELGFSMLGHEELPAKVFASMLKSCMGNDYKPMVKDDKKVTKPPSSPARAPVERKEEPEPPSKQAQKGAPAQPAEADSSAGKANGYSGAPSHHTLYVVVPDSPDGTEEQVLCSGQYNIEEKKANGKPLWKHIRGDRWLYFGNDDCWYIGDEEEAEMNFNCDQGYIRQGKRGQSLPHELPGPWERGPDWKPDQRITVATEAGAAPAAGGKGKSKKKPKNKH